MKAIDQAEGNNSHYSGVLICLLHPKVRDLENNDRIDIIMKLGEVQNGSKKQRLSIVSA